MLRSVPLLAAAVVVPCLFVFGCGKQASLDRVSRNTSSASRTASSADRAADDERSDLRYGAPADDALADADASEEQKFAERNDSGAARPLAQHAQAKSSVAAETSPAGAQPPVLKSPSPDAPQAINRPFPEGPSRDGGQGAGRGGDKFDRIEDNDFQAAADRPLSTFSIDVDTASYAKTRRYLMQNGSMPPPDAVRIEEFINYFEYGYASPEDLHPFAVHVEMADCPWRDGHRIARIGIQGRRIQENRPPTNLVFLIDVSGSMDYADKLPLVKQSLNMLASRLHENDRVAIVVYAGAAGLVLPSTTGDKRSTIESALERLHAGGSTNGGQGIHLAYQVALDNYITGGVNRVLLCTDGDFNVGTTSTGDLIRLAQQQAKSGVYLSVLAFGQGNHNDAMLEQLSNKANGNYAFIDTQAEAHKVLVQQLSSTLVTIAKDVKLQVEFNPQRVASYRLIGYENRKLAARDFNDDKKDAGEIGAGHQVTALYEIVPTGEDTQALGGTVDPLKYQKREAKRDIAVSQEWMTVKVRYKQPDEDTSTLLTYPVALQPKRFGQTNADFQFVSAVASFGMLLRGSEHRGDATYASVWEIASSALGDDSHGYRREFLGLVRRAATMDNRYPAELPETVSQWTAPPRQTSPLRMVSPANVSWQRAVHPQPMLPETPQSFRSAQSPWWASMIPGRFLSIGSIFWMGATFGLLVACVVAFSFWKLPRVRLEAARSAVGPSHFKRSPDKPPTRRFR